MRAEQTGCPIPTRPERRYRYPPPVAAAGVTLSLAGALVEMVWWLLQNDHGWRNFYRFLQAGTPFWWSLGLSTAGALLTAIHWYYGYRSRWWAAPGLVLTAAGLIRIVVALLILGGEPSVCPVPASLCPQRPYETSGMAQASRQRRVGHHDIRFGEPTQQLLLGVL